MKVKFEGGLELQAALKGLGDKALSKRVAERALKIAAQPIRDEAVALAPDDPATPLDQSLKTAIKIGRKENTKGLRRFKRTTAGQDTAEVWVGIDPSVREPRDSKTKRSKSGSTFLQSGGGVAAYSQFVEFGTSTHAAKPYMRPAWESKKMVAFDLIGPELWKEIEKATARAARKALRKAAK